MPLPQRPQAPIANSARPSSPQQVARSFSAYSAQNPLGQTYFSELGKDMQNRITNQFGISAEQWDNPNSYHANLLRSQLAASMKDPNDMRFHNYASQYKQYASVPQMMSVLDKNIGWDRAKQRWMDHKNDVAPSSSPVVPQQPTTVATGGRGARQAPGSPPSSAKPVSVGGSTGQTGPSGGGGVMDDSPQAPAPRPVAPQQNIPSPAPKPMPRPASPSQTPPAPKPEVPDTSTRVLSRAPVKKGSAMTDKQMFKVAFLSKCIEQGMTIDEIHLRVKQALHLKKADPLSAAVEFIKTVPTIGLAGIGLAGGGGYYLGNKVIGPGIHEAIKPPIPDKEDMMREELINEYDRQSELIKRQSELARRKRLRDMNISGVTRY